MFSKEKAKNEILEILNNPPAYDDMVSDLRMHNVQVSHKPGNSDGISLADKNIVERVWKSYKINTVLEKQMRNLKTLGIKASVVYQNIQGFLKEIESDVGTKEEGPIEGFLENGYVEFEIFSPQKKTRN
ncbi:MAG: hypothetical protein WC775_04010 [Patescibacteria group bacterium]|jgi:hypothetical protein